tara:strand:- start:56307 stop:57254 length:948 start_codon:yes stop_codon:yes gene_type:complete
LFKVGIIGLNFGGNVHIPAYQKSNQFEITGIFDNGSGKGKLLKKKYSLNCKIYSDVEKMIFSEENNLIDICSPTFTHSKYLKKVYDAKKNVICEKPMGESFSQIIGLADKFEKKKLINIINYEFRFEFLMNELKKIIKKNKEIKEIDISWLIGSTKVKGWKATQKKGGGIVNELLCHIIDYLYFLLEIKDLFSMTCLKKKILRNSCHLTFQIKQTLINIKIVRSLRIKKSEHVISVQGKKESAILSYFHPFSSKDKKLIVTKESSKKKIKNADDKKNISDDRILSFYNLIDSVKKKTNHTNFKDAELIRKYLDNI